MKIAKFAVVAFILLCQNITFGQNLVEITLAQHFSKEMIANTLGPVAGDYDVDVYKVIYTMVDHMGTVDTVSGIIGVPIDILDSSAVVIYCHGTTSGPQDAPSNMQSGLSETLLFSSNGFTTATPDYIGLGISADRFHPYIHGESEALAAYYMLDLTYHWMESLEIPARQELFLTGYSQGGHASMFLQKLLSTSLSDYKLTAAAHGSGPYSLSEVMRTTITSGEEYLAGLAYVPYVVLGFQSASGDLYDSLVEVFRPAFVGSIEKFYRGEINLGAMGQEIGTVLFFTSTPLSPRYILQDSIIAVLDANDSTNRFVQYLYENNTYDFLADIPTRLYYCEADEQVPYENALFADSAMHALGATDLEAISLNPNGDHGACALLALPAANQFFKSFISGSSTYSPYALHEVTITPNPARDYVQIKTSDNHKIERVVFSNFLGQTVLSMSSPQSNMFDISSMSSGQYIVAIDFSDGERLTTMLTIE